MTLINIIIGIILFLIGIVGHELMHVIQLKMRGIESYWIEWFPVDHIPRVWFFYDPDDTEKLPSEYVEVIPVCFTAFMWLLAFAFITT